MLLKLVFIGLVLQEDNYERHWRNRCEFLDYLHAAREKLEELGRTVEDVWYGEIFTDREFFSIEEDLYLNLEFRMQVEINGRDRVAAYRLDCSELEHIVRRMGGSERASFIRHATDKIIRELMEHLYINGV